MIVRKLTNISDFSITVDLNGGNGIIVPPGAVIENVDVGNVDDLRGIAKIEQDLSEIPLREGKKYLKG
jgi:hypothetical protein